MNLIVPIAGQSSRFPGLRPKWMLTHPNGKFMVTEAISGLNLEDFEKITFTYLTVHEDTYHFKRGLMEELEDNKLLNKVHFIGLPKPTRDQVETVYHALNIGNIPGPFFVKDSDNYFQADIKPGNCVCYYNLNEAGLIKSSNKSYLAKDDYGRITNIVEKEIISPFFCVGGYGFKDAQTFISTYQQLEEFNEKYLSHVIYQNILDGERFQALHVQKYLDWGTIEDWEKFKKSFATLFIDMDGVLAQHSSSHFPPYYGETGSIKENVEIIHQLQKTGRIQIIITTARQEKYRKLTLQQLHSFGIEFSQLLMQINHNKRIIINDYSSSNSYKSCDAINLKRDSGDLREILASAMDYGFNND